MRKMTLDDLIPPHERNTTCETCRNSGKGDPRDWHHYRHPYKGPWTTPSSSQEPDDGPQVVRAPFDPVLRQALMDKGVLTVDDLKNAEAKILMVSGVFQSVVREAMKAEEAQAYTKVLGGESSDVPGRSTLDSS